MVITRKKLAVMVAEAVRNRIIALAEEDGPKKPTVSSADEDESDEPSGTPDKSGIDQEKDPDGPAVDGDQPDPDAVDKDGDKGEDATGAVNNEVSGKTVQALSIEPNSKLLPGAKEVTLSFHESSDTLRILVTATGQVKFFWRGELHDVP